MKQPTLRENRLLPSAVEAIGSTPLVELTRLTAGLEGRILAKLEYLNPGFSKKDRIARQIIEDAEAQGLLQPGATVVELTSGNTGTGLAIVCVVKGYHFVAVMSRGNSMERARMMVALGVEVVLVDQLPGRDFCRFSSGANTAAALHLLQTDFPGATIVVLMCDSGLKYLSTDLWEPFQG